MRARIGQRTTQRQRQKEDATARRERELAERHAEVRFAAYVTVSAPAGPGDVGAIDDLEGAVSRVELEAERAPRMFAGSRWGEQRGRDLAGRPRVGGRAQDDRCGRWRSRSMSTWLRTPMCAKGTAGGGWCATGTRGSAA